MLVLYAIIWSISDAFVYEAPQIGRPLPIALGLFVACFAAYLLAIYCGVHSDSKHVGLTIVAFALAFRLVLLFSVPIQEIDIYRYIWDGHVAMAGVSPFKYAPAEVLNVNPFATDQEISPELVRLRNLRDESEAKKRILERIHYGHVPTVYPPVSQAVFRLAAATTPRKASFSEHVVVMKAWIVAFDMATIFVLWGMLRLANMPTGWLASYAWCPLVMKEFANSGHLDSIAVCFAAIAIALVADTLFGNQERSRRRQTIQLLVASVILALGVGAKLYPVVLTPLIAFTLWKQRGPLLAIATGGLFVVATLVFLFPLLRAEKSTEEPVEQNVALVEQGVALDDADSYDPKAGLKVFLSNWMMNDLIFLNLVENATPDHLRPASAPRPWFVVLPDSLRRSITNASSWLFAVEESSGPFYFARAITALIFLVLACIFALQASKAETAQAWFSYVFLTMAWFWLLLPTLNPWYWIWALPWVAFAKNRVWLLLSGLLFTYYLRFHIGAHFAQQRIVRSLPYQGETFFDYVVVWFEYLPWFIGLLAVFAFRAYRSKRIATAT